MTRGPRGLAVATFLGMAILFLSTRDNRYGAGVADGLMVYMGNEARREKRQERRTGGRGNGDRPAPRVV
jgi:hypothetical protein